MKIFSSQLWNEKKAQFDTGMIEVSKGRIQQFHFGKIEKRDRMSKIIDMGDLAVLPSAIDLHIHSRDFDESHKETFQTLEAQAFCGGLSVAVCMANTFPRLDSELTIREFFKRTKSLKLKCIPFAAVSKNLEGKVATDWNALLRLSVAGLSDDGKPILNAEMMKAAAKAVQKFGKILSLHEEDTSHSCGSLLHRSVNSIRLGIEGSPSEAEGSMVERDLRIAQETKAHLHFGHLSSKEAVDLLRKARRQKISFSAELTPHHGLLTVDAAESFDLDRLSTFKVCPPIRSQADRAALRAALKEGIIDCFASDHAPHSTFEKDRSMASAAHGMIAAEYHFSLYNEIRVQSKISWATFMRAWRTRPAELLGLQKQKQWAAGGDADILVVDLNASQRADFQRSKSKNSPFAGKTLKGKVMAHWLSGERVYVA